MKTIISTIAIAYCLLLFGGYIGMKYQGEKARPFCESLMKLDLVWIMLMAPGEANACLDLGVLPMKEKQ